MNNNNSRLRSDVTTATTESGLLVRHGDEETTRIVGAESVEEARTELVEKGLLLSGGAGADWRRILAGKWCEAKIALALGPEEFGRALAEHGLLSGPLEADVQLFVEIGVDVAARAAFNRDMWRKRTRWLWLQIPNLFEMRWCAFAPGETACAHCLEVRLLNNRRNGTEYQAVLEANGGKLAAAGMSAVREIARGIAVLESFRLAAGIPIQSLGRIVSLDLGSFTTEAERILPLPRCEVCGDREQC